MKKAPFQLTLILAGVAINSLGGALTALVLNLSPNPFAAYEIFFLLGQYVRFGAYNIPIYLAIDNEKRNRYVIIVYPVFFHHL